MAILAGGGIGANDNNLGSGISGGVGDDFFDPLNTAIAGTATSISLYGYDGSGGGNAAPVVKVKQWRIVGSDYVFVAQTGTAAMATGLNTDVALNTPLTLLAGDVISLHTSPTVALPAGITVHNATAGSTTWEGAASDYTTTQPISKFGTSFSLALNYTLNGTPTATNTITSDAVKQGTQRSLTTSAFSVTGSGTYTGTPTTIERQVRYADGAEEVVLAWSTYDATPSDGTFTGTIDLTANIRPFKIDYRFSNDTGVTDTSNNFYGGDYVLTCGESLSKDMLTEGTGTPSAGVLTVNMSTGALTSSTSGAGQIANANAITSESGVAVFMMNAGIDSLHMLQENGSPYLLGATTTSYDTLIAAYNLAGNVVFVNFIMGVNDAYDQVSTPEDYKQSYADFFTALRADTRANLEIICTTTGRHLSGVPDDQLWTDFVIAQKEAFDSATNLYYTALYDLPLIDDVHLTVAGYEDLGVRLANAAIAGVLGGSESYQPPQITTVVHTSLTETVFNISIPSGTDFTPLTGITDAALSDDDFSTSLTISSVEQLTATSFKAVHESATVTNYRYNWGAAPTITGIVQDDSAVTLPLLQAQGTVVVQSTINITAAGIPDGDHVTYFYDQTNEIGLDKQTLTYESDTASATLSVDVGTTVWSFVEPTDTKANSGFADIGDTE